MRSASHRSVLTFPDCRPGCRILALELPQSLDAARLLYEAPLLHAGAADLGSLCHHAQQLLAAAQTGLAGGRLQHVQVALAAMQVRGGCPVPLRARSMHGYTTHELFLKLG